METQTFVGSTPEAATEKALEFMRGLDHMRQPDMSKPYQIKFMDAHGIKTTMNQHWNVDVNFRGLD